MNSVSVWLGHRDFRLLRDLSVRFPAFRESMGRTNGDFREAVRAYLHSSFVRYHRFVVGAQGGAQREQVPRGVMDLPVPIDPVDASSIRPWVDLSGQDGDLSTVDDLTCRALKLRESERWLVEDFIRIKRPALLSGETALPPDEVDLLTYAETLRDTLDQWLDRGERYRQKVLVVAGPRAGVVRVESEITGQPHAVVIDRDGNETTCHKMAAPVIFEHERLNGDDPGRLRSVLRLMEDNVYLHLPMRRLWWTRSRALHDADDIIAHMIHAGGKRENHWRSVVHWTV